MWLGRKARAGNGSEPKRSRSCASRAEAAQAGRPLPARGSTETFLNEYAILDSIEELVACLDADMTVRWANRAAGESVASEPERLIGRRCYEIWHQRG